MTCARSIATTQLAVPALAALVDKRLCDLLIATNEEFASVRTWLNSREFLVVPLVPRGTLLRLQDSYVRLWPISANLLSDGPYWRKLRKRVGLPATGCEICGSRDAEPVHVVADATGRKARGTTSYYWALPINIVYLCAQHRAEVERARYARRPTDQVRHLLKRRRRLNSILRRQAKRELVSIKLARKRARDAWHSLELSAHRETVALAAAMLQLAERRSEKT